MQEDPTTVMIFCAALAAGLKAEASAVAEKRPHGLFPPHSFLLLPHGLPFPSAIGGLFSKIGDSTIILPSSTAAIYKTQGLLVFFPNKSLSSTFHCIDIRGKVYRISAKERLFKNESWQFREATGS
ncbi:UNVERIFIED_CONTAM: hypothetical protein K2H54_066485 [Gekko kuhli]